MIVLSVLDIDVVVECEPAAVRALLRATLGGFSPAVPPVAAVPQAAVRYRVEALPATAGYRLRRDGEEVGVASDDAELVWMLDGDLVVEIQRRRRELFFVHAAVLEWGGRAIVLVGSSGAGKSVTAWAMLHEGFGFLSDEIAPIDADAGTVHPYPRALSLKDDTAAPALPAAAVTTARSVHVPTSALPGPAWRTPLILGAVFFLHHERHAAAPALSRIGAAEATARMYAHALNALAHPHCGLEAAMAIAGRCASFVVTTADLRATASLLRRVAASEVGTTGQPARGSRRR